ncbi:hypothetical protein I7I50_09334 [Histoplasma capsulatum G186AR]|uniref:Uncharacterized protein n=1 Tax=Ajellomyces capsulatus TaxID=5037 RepID=A0A8H7YU16_AJECA|nr:hypothetical protein I7I52_06855 [Histoplasma capsulatum]QSS74240.1 hypothetical protein I7I50_09334 [Histoplasma capsulatum G186AR]
MKSQKPHSPLHIRSDIAWKFLSRFYLFSVIGMPAPRSRSKLEAWLLLNFRFTCLKCAIGLGIPHPPSSEAGCRSLSEIATPVQCGPRYQPYHGFGSTSANDTGI